LRWLTLKSKKDPEEDQDESHEPPAKRRKVTQKKKLTKRVFDLAPNKMLADEPHSSKKTIPFRSMVAEKWLKTYPDMALLDGGEWLKGFYGALAEKDVFKQDWAYLKELDEWQKRVDEVGFEPEQSSAA
jgi:hypothetical protein